MMFAPFWIVAASFWIIRPICCAEMSTTDYRPTPYNIAEDRKPQSRGSLKKKRESMAVFTKFRNTRHVEVFSEMSSVVMKEEAVTSHESSPYVATAYYRIPTDRHKNLK